MECPVCGERLRTAEKFGIEIEICPDCKGVWLDRGKLEAILSQAASNPAQVAGEAQPLPVQALPYREHHHEQHDHHHDDDEHGEYDHDRRYGQHRRRGSWLGDLLGGLGGDD